jgi:hypothetical protein
MVYIVTYFLILDDRFPQAILVSFLTCPFYDHLTMVHTVALLAPNGNVGSAALRHLLPTHKAAKLNLVVLHRPGSPPKDLDLGLGVEVREIDLEGPIENIQEAVRGVNAAM